MGFLTSLPEECLGCDPLTEIQRKKSKALLWLKGFNRLFNHFAWRVLWSCPLFELRLFPASHFVWTSRALDTFSFWRKKMIRWIKSSYKELSLLWRPLWTGTGSSTAPPVTDLYLASICFESKWQEICLRIIIFQQLLRRDEWEVFYLFFFLVNFVLAPLLFICRIHIG